MKIEGFIYIFCITVGLIGTLNCASTTGKMTTRNTPPRTSGQTTQRTTPRTSAAPSYSYCYSCQYGLCPLPFRSSSLYVSRDVSYSGWCVKISDTTSLDSRASRGVGTSICSSRGCSWRIVSGVNKYVCCCHGNLCNSALATSKLNIFILFLSFLSVNFIKKIFF
ncbi:hypothetical protein I4U23_015987 [Adineta vaga]|nr:hypothetical protein I4U23_015987 [Adineta vaga]